MIPLYKPPQLNRMSADGATSSGELYADWYEDTIVGGAREALALVNIDEGMLERVLELPPDQLTACKEEILAGDDVVGHYMCGDCLLEILDELEGGEP